MNTGALVMEKMKFEDARGASSEDLPRVTQAMIAQRAKLSPITVFNCERGKPIQRTTAHAMLRALNDIRQGKQLNPLAFDDILWNIK